MIFTQGGPMDAANWNEDTGERRVRKPTSVVRRGAGGKGPRKWYLACCLPYFLLGFVGPRSEAEEIKQHIGTFLREELNLELSKTKTLITHARSEAARFLGYEITTLHKDTKRSLNRSTGKKRRSINGRVGLRIPADVLTDKCNGYKRRRKAIQRAELLNE